MSLALLMHRENLTLESLKLDIERFRDRHLLKGKVETSYRDPFNGSGGSWDNDKKIVFIRLEPIFDKWIELGSKFSFRLAVLLVAAHEWGHSAFDNAPNFKRKSILGHEARLAHRLGLCEKTEQKLRELENVYVQEERLAWEKAVEWLRSFIDESEARRWAERSISTYKRQTA